MLKISISGVRGIVDESLTAEVAENFARAFGTYTKGGKIVIGRDTRSHGEYLKKIILLGLKSSGCEIIDLGICPTPTVGILTKHLRARGGIVITASHNPPQWNGIKFFGADGIFLTPEEFNKLVKLYEKNE